MKNKKKIIIPIIALILIVGIILVGVYINFNIKPSENNETNVIIHNKVGMANPSSTYCGALGYKEKTIESVGFCIFPDGTECSEWTFFRGKCGQKWSYCELKNYDLKNLSETEGWGPDGSVCMNKNSGEEIGNVFDLVNAEFKG